MILPKKIGRNNFTHCYKRSTYNKRLSIKVLYICDIGLIIAKKNQEDTNCVTTPILRIK